MRRSSSILLRRRAAGAMLSAALAFTVPEIAAGQERNGLRAGPAQIGTSDSAVTRTRTQTRPRPPAGASPPVASLLPAPAAAGSSCTEWTALSLSGSIRAGRLAVAPGMRLPAGASIQIDSGGAIQLLGCRRLAAILRGPLRAQLGGGRFDVLLARGDGARIGGTGVVRLAGGWSVELRPPGASVLLDGYLVHVLAGAARFLPPTGGERQDWPAALVRMLAGRARPAAAPERDEIEARAGQVFHLRLGGEVVRVAARPDPERTVAVAELAFGEPPAFAPALEVSAAEARQTADWSRSRGQAARASAGCGCSESNAGAVAPSGDKGGQSKVIEGALGTLRVRVSGLPRVGARAGQGE